MYLYICHLKLHINNKRGFITFVFIYIVKNINFWKYSTNLNNSQLLLLYEVKYIKDHYGVEKQKTDFFY